MTKLKIQNWRAWALMAGLSAAPLLVKKAIKAGKPEYEKRKAQLEDYLDSRNGIETDYQEHGFDVKMPYVRSDGELIVKYSYDDKLSGPEETLSLIGESDGKNLETILVREKKKKVTVTHAEVDNILDKDNPNSPKEIFETIYTGANLGKYEERWRLRNYSKLSPK